MDNDSGPVYPRACGGTAGVTSGCRGMVTSGLSPRVRGNRALSGLPSRATTGVYPRACGGTDRLAETWLLHVRSIPARAGEPPGIRNSALTGLSPRVRGNRPIKAMLTRAGRSIPARAGEPYADRTSMNWSIPARAGEPVSREPRTRRRVYPRACGGNLRPPSLRHSGDMAGLSPRVRGNLSVASVEASLIYPRACGGTFQPTPD